MNNICPDNLTLNQIMKLIDNIDILDEKKKIEIKVRKFYEFIQWTDEQYEEYKKLYEKLENVNQSKKNGPKNYENTKEKGDALENIVDFIFNKSFFLKVHPNKRNSTNEIDQFIVISDYGKQALHEYNWNKSFLGLNQDFMICECKNYNKKVASTWVGKFNTLLDCCGNCQLGIIFSYHGLTGNENNWYDAHGLTKIIYRLSSENKKTFILDFNKNDFKLLLDKNYNIFTIIDSKKKSLISGVKSYNFLKDDEEKTNKIIEIYNEISHTN